MNESFITLIDIRSRIVRFSSEFRNFMLNSIEAINGLIHNFNWYKHKRQKGFY